MKLVTALTALVALFLATTTTSQTTPKEPTGKPAPTKAPFVFESGDVELRELIERCGAYLQRNILVADSELSPPQAPKRGPRAQAPAAAEDAAADSGPIVSLQLPVVTDVDGCEDMLSSLLWMHGLAMVPLDEARGVYEILSMQGARQSEIPTRAVQRTREQVLARPALRQFVTVVLTLEHTNATMANNALRPFYAHTGGPGTNALTLGNVGNATAIILLGPQDLVASAVLVLEAADVPQAPEQPQLATRVEALAKQNAELLARLAAIESRLDKR